MPYLFVFKESHIQDVVCDGGWGERFDYSETLHIMLQSLGLFYKQWHDIEEFETGG